MLSLPQEVVVVLYAFAPLFSRPVWSHATTLAIGAILSTGKKTVTSALRVMGLRQEERFTNFHRVLNRAKWHYSPTSEPAGIEFVFGLSHLELFYADTRIFLMMSMPLCRVNLSISSMSAGTSAICIRTNLP
ncbi:MAG: hypothetical protein BA873_04375 [Desulfobulbaceae bacterium C00003063]|nr:MAG: hypothetical protein BA873_04375 [Desulfobulbaceae bacterium C00003063]